MPRVIVVANGDKHRSQELAEEAENELRKLGAEAVISTTWGDDLSVHAADLAVIFGGDGTVLGAVSTLGETPPPILAFNIGHLGYLAENPPAMMREILKQALAGELQSSRRMMIEGEVKNSTTRRHDVALNEFVLSYRQNHRQLVLSVCVDAEELMQVRGDGMIIATPTGSTAYSLSAGGPVLSPDLSAMILTPLCPHQLANRSLVLNPTENVVLTHRGDTPVEVIADGRTCFVLEKDEEFTVRLSQRKVTFLYQTRGRYRLLRDKLGWGWLANI